MKRNEDTENCMFQIKQQQKHNFTDPVTSNRSLLDKNWTKVNGFTCVSFNLIFQYLSSFAFFISFAFVLQLLIAFLSIVLNFIYMCKVKL